MTLHRLTEVTMGVPNLEETAAYYRDFGLIPLEPGIGREERVFGTVDGGRQLRLVHAGVRRLISLGIGADDHDDLGRIAAALRHLNIPSRLDGDQLKTHEPVTGLEVLVTVIPRLVQEPTPTPSYNSPGNITRSNQRAAALFRPGPVRPRRLGHVAIGTVNKEATERFFLDGIGCKLSDAVEDKISFTRCSTDHHNVVIQSAPVNFLHHTSWEVDDVDEIGRGAQSMLEDHPERHIWGLGRHWVGANFYYLFVDPAGNFSEYFSDMDEIVDDQMWSPEVFDQSAANLWSTTSAPPSLISPDDLAELMAGLH